MQDWERWTKGGRGKETRERVTGVYRKSRPGGSWLIAPPSGEMFRLESRRVRFPLAGASVRGDPGALPRVTAPPPPSCIFQGCDSNGTARSRLTSRGIATNSNPNSFFSSLKKPHRSQLGSQFIRFERIYKKNQNQSVPVFVTGPTGPGWVLTAVRWMTP